MYMQRSNERVCEATEGASDEGTVGTIRGFGTGRRKIGKGSGGYGRAFASDEDQLLSKMSTA